jgi:hypothetical protein
LAKTLNLSSTKKVPIMGIDDNYIRFSKVNFVSKWSDGRAS